MELSEFHYLTAKAGIQDADAFKFAPLQNHEKHAIDLVNQGHGLTQQFINLFQSNQQRSHMILRVLVDGMRVLGEGLKHAEAACKRSLMARRSPNSKNNIFVAQHNMNLALVRFMKATAVVQKVASSTASQL
jgi:hypothetical protein